MKYLIVGTGGTGSSIGAFLLSIGKDVTFIARGEKLKVMKEKGLLLKSTIKGDLLSKNASYVSEDEYSEKADVIFVCVKAYSVDSIISIVNKAAKADTIIIPVMNGYSMGNAIASKIECGIALEGCIYISAFIESPGVSVQLGNLFKVVFGPKQGQMVDMAVLNKVKDDLISSGIDGILSENIERDTYKKYSFISSYAACGAFYDCTAKEMQDPGEIHDAFVKLGGETELVGKALGIEFESSLVDGNLAILNSLTPDTTASMQKDMKAGNKTEIDGLVFEIVKLAKALEIDVPMYKKVSKHFGYNM